ncbi:MAG TPA: type II CAAX endopeptidase family protein [Mucilaginibacter sp.]|nr:type II CAAX endopeptidase family protein [Mucilaginibacter sp.]
MSNNNQKLIPRLGIYFLLAFLIAWGTWFPAFLHPASLKLLSFIGLFAPALSAIFIVSITDGKQGVKALLGRYKILRFHAGWYIFAVLFVPLLFILALAADSVFFHTEFKNLLVTGSPIIGPVSFIWLIFINSGEEIGWRGFALPRLQKLLKSPIYASLILGIFWSLWHLPIYLVPGQSSIPLPLFLFFTIGLSFIYTLVFNQTRGSLFSVVLLHASTDVIPRIFNITLFSARTWLIFGIMTWVSVIILFGVFRKQNVEVSQTGLVSGQRS